jgi:hypothetical protein
VPVRETQCAFCEKSFSFYHAPSSKPQRYCSVRCRGRALSRSRQGWKQPASRHQPEMAALNVSPLGMQGKR